MKNFVKISVIAITMLLIPYLVCAHNYGVIDIDELNKSPQVDEANKRLEKEFAARKEAFEAKNNEWNEKQNKLQRDKDILSAAEKTKLEKESNKLQNTLQQMDEKYRMEYTSRYRDEMDQFQKVLKEVVAKIRKDEKMMMIFPNQALVDYAPEVDITTKVLSALEKQSKHAVTDKKHEKGK